MIHLALATNGNYFVGFIVTVVSALRASASAVFHVHVIDGGLSPSQRAHVRRAVAGLSREHVVEFHALNPAMFAGLRTDYGNSYLTYARIVSPRLIAVDKLLYLDCDLLVLRDISPIWTLDLGDNLAAASQDPGIKLLRDDYPLAGDCGDEKYFNAGVLLLNLAAWRQAGIEAKLLTMLSRDPQSFKWWDQTAMNALFRGRVLYMDANWNVPAEAFSLGPTCRAAIIHYIGPHKPWMRYFDQPSYRLWLQFCQRWVPGGRRLLRRRSLVLSYLDHCRYALTQRSALLRAATAMARRLTGRPPKPPAPASAASSSRVSTSDLVAFAQQRWEA